MDYTKSGDWELGVVIERRKWVEGMEIRDQILELGRDLTFSFDAVPTIDTVLYFRGSTKGDRDRWR